MNEPLSRITSFYYPMLLLPAPRRRALEWLYRFCREADDIADNPGTVAGKSRRLKGFRLALRKGFKAGDSCHPILGPYLMSALPLGVTLPPLETILDGVELDIRKVRMRTFGELSAYSEKVAGGPGLASMEIFGFPDARHRGYAVNLGIFLQLVNVVRDAKEDLSMGRLYLPVEDWKRFGLMPGKLPPPGPVWDSFARFQLDRARVYWRKACACLDRPDRGRLATAESIAAVYGCLCRKLVRDPSSILQGRVGLSMPEKLLAVAGAALRCLFWRGLLNP